MHPDGCRPTILIAIVECGIFDRKHHYERSGQKTSLWTLRPVWTNLSFKMLSISETWNTSFRNFGIEKYFSVSQSINQSIRRSPLSRCSRRHLQRAGARTQISRQSSCELFTTNWLSSNFEGVTKVCSMQLKQRCGNPEDHIACYWSWSQPNHRGPQSEAWHAQQQMLLDAKRHRKGNVPRMQLIV